ncbi:MAG: magnesium transporter CorA family protein [Candidatus Bipolaricaulota bacterium]|nr:magnesium transporter CorA family protein [Candidatus Bipolaricaulota bacterium]MDW8031351.1 magnesium transporter CorA family protein [Candidatus Bipolaricaulota bacterium]
MRTFLYEEGKGLVTDVPIMDLVAKAEQESTTLWIDFSQSEVSEIQKIGKLFNLHPLAIEDLISPQRRPKVDAYDNGLMIVLRDTDVDRIEKSLSALELDIFLGRNFLITVHSEHMECIEMAIARLNGAAARVIGRGPDYLAHMIIDFLVDDNLQLLSWLEAEISELEEAIYTNPTNEALKQAAKLRKNIIYLQRILGPQLELIRRLSSDELPFIKKSLRAYFRDVYDNLARINDLVHSYREIITADIQIHQGLIANKSNKILAILTIVFTLSIPATIVGTFYGMNINLPGGIETGPWLFWGPYTTFIVIVIGSLLIPGALMLWWFKYRGWLE